MKKIHDIKLRGKKKAAAKHRHMPLAPFWEERKTPTKKQSPINWTPFVIFLMILSIGGLIYGRAYVVYADFQKEVANTKKSLSLSMDYLQQGKFDSAITESEKAKAGIQNLKLNLQSWGQDSAYLKIIGYRSGLVDAESMLDSINQTLSISGKSKTLVEELSAQFGGGKLANGQDLNTKVDLVRVNGLFSDMLGETDNLISELEKTDIGFIMSNSDREGYISSAKKVKDSIFNIQKNYIPLLSWYLGDEKEKNIMILFQNNAELRASGGFIGSYAIMKTEDSSIKRIDIQTNIYKLDTASLGKVNIPSLPEFSVLYDGKVFLRDANYAVDGPESFAKVLELYKLESGSDLDGIIAIDTSVITDLLKITGPIAMPQYNMTVGSDNFLKDVQYEVEQNYFARDGGKTENEPKKVLSDLMPLLAEKIFEQLKNGEGRDKVMTILSGSVHSKHILLYSKDEATEKLVTKLNLGAKVNQDNYDYLFSHSTNIGGGKSSLSMDENVTDNIKISEDGSVSHQITLSRTHNGTSDWPDGNNINLIRFLLPSNSEIKSFEPQTGNYWPNMSKKKSKEPDHYLGTEAGKEKLSFWMNTAPGETSKLIFSYISSYKLLSVEANGGSDRYQLYIQKEAGTPNYRYNVNISYPDNWTYNDSQHRGDIKLNFLLDKDVLLDLKFN